MADNPRWCQPLSGWKAYYGDWLAAHDPAATLQHLRFFDLRSVHGTDTLVDQLKAFIVSKAKNSPGFIPLLVNDCLARRAPLSVFHGGVVDKEGRVETTLDIGEQGLGPYITFTRILALVNGVRETSTFGRLDILHKEGHLGDELKSKIQEACEILMHLQLIHQLHQVEKGVVPDSLLLVGELTELEKKMLKDSFEQVGALHQMIAEHTASQMPS